MAKKSFLKKLEYSLGFSVTKRGRASSKGWQTRRKKQAKALEGLNFGW